MESLTKFLTNFRRDPLTSWCGLVALLSYSISNNPGSVAFLGPDVATFLVGMANFLKEMSLAAGLFFAAQSRPETLVEKDVIKEVLTENQPEGKKELMSDESDVNQKKIN
jgi:hypothetical protein